MLALLVLLTVLSLAVPAPIPPAAQETCVVERIVDADTFVCGGGERVRLLLVDAPERGQAPFGPLATAELERLMPPGISVRLVTDVDVRDRYGRLLAHVHLPDGTWLNREIVRRGYAVPMVIPPNVRRVEEIRAAAEEARREGRGLWSVGFFEETAPQGTPSGPPPLVPRGRGEGGGARGAASTAARARGACDPSYPEVCIPPPPPDLDCRDVPHRRFEVVGADPHRFDGDHDGIGCEG